jgi:hypothetical protein
MKYLLILLVFIFSSVKQFAQVKERELKKRIDLLMPMPMDDTYKGTRGGSVVWNPVLKKYYAVFAGNKGYPLGIFDATGKLLSDIDQEAKIDHRGLWYVPETKTIMGNGYDSIGWFKYQLDAKGNLISVKELFPGLNQPDEQAVGTYNFMEKNVLFLSGTTIKKYNLRTAKEIGSKQLHIGKTANDKNSELDPQELPEGYNTTSVIFTGISGGEIGLLNSENRQIELYNYKTGFLTYQLNLPLETPVEMSFNFAYTNGIFWLFDISERTWRGYK